MRRSPQMRTPPLKVRQTRVNPPNPGGEFFNCVRDFFNDEILAPLCAQFDRPAPLRKLSLQMTMARDQGRPMPATAKSILELMKSPLLHQWLRLTKDFEHAKEQPSEIEVFQFVLGSYNSLHWSPLLVSEELKSAEYASLTHWLRQGLRQVAKKISHPSRRAL